MAFHALPEYCSWLDLPRLRYSNQHMIFGMCTKLFNSFLLSKLTGSILNRKYYTYLDEVQLAAPAAPTQQLLLLAFYSQPHRGSLKISRSPILLFFKAPEGL